MAQTTLKKQTVLFIVDGQVDFCADATHPVAPLLPAYKGNPFVPDGTRMGALYVPGAMDDTKRLVDHMMNNLKEYDDIYATLDSHQEIHIAHPSFWMDRDGNAPTVFTPISVDDVKSGAFTTRMPSQQKYGLDYVETLKANGRYGLTIWPVHCVVGSLGHALMPELSDALRQWEATRFGRVNYVPKGNNYRTEHFSGLQADVPDPGDPTTKLNTNLIQALENPEVGKIRFVGQALSHCVANTMRDLIENFGSGSAAKIELVRNMSSNVPGCDKLGDEFLNWFESKGGQITTI